MALGSFGQTFFIALFGGHLREVFDLSNGSLGTAYAAGTFASALTLQRVGRWIDWAGLRRFSMAVGLLLAGACALMAVNTTLAGLVLSFYLLRLGGQGLMVHTAMTATARAFSRERGTALALANLGGAARGRGSRWRAWMISCRGRLRFQGQQHGAVWQRV
jgi:sugar phosphate permease